MLNISIEFDEHSFDDQLKHYLEGPFRESVSRALTAVARDCVAELRRVVDKVFDAPTPFTELAFGVTPARPGDAEPSAFVFVYSRQAEYLELEVYGGLRKAGDYATTQFGPVIALRDAALNSFGNMPQGYIVEQEAEGAVWLHLGAHHNPVLVKHDGDGKLEFLAEEIPEAHYAPRLDFYGTVLEVVQKSFGQELLDAWNRPQ